MSRKIGRNHPCPCGSGKKYKKCHGSGRPQPSTNETSPAGLRLAGSFHGKRFFVRDTGVRPDLSFADLVDACRPFDVWQALSIIRRASKQIADGELNGIQVNSDDTDVVATPAELAKLAAALLSGAEPGGKSPTDRDFADLLRRVFRLREPILEQAHPTREELELHISRMMYFEAPWQKERRHVLPRSLLLFKLLEEQKPSLTSGSLGQFFEKNLGMGVYEWMLLGFIAWVVGGRRGGFISAPELSDTVRLLPGLRERLGDAKVQTFLQRIAVSRMDFRRMGSQHDAADQRVRGLAKYAFNPLFRFPIITLDAPVVLGGKAFTHIEPMEWLTLEAVSSGNYYRLIDAREGALGRALGLVFQEYVGELLRQCLPAGSAVIPEEPYRLEGNSYDSADWTLVEGEQATLIECKLASLRMGGKVGWDYPTYADETEAVATAIEQARRFERHVREAPERWPTFRKVKRFHHLVVLYDTQFLANSVMRRALEPRLTGAQHAWHAINVDEFEYLFDVLRRRRLCDVLAAKESKPNYEMDFREFSSQRLEKDLSYVNPLLQSVWDRYFDFGQLGAAALRGRPS